MLALLSACGPRTYLPPVPAAFPATVAAGEREVALARKLAPLLYLQRDESFPLLRVVAVVDTARRIVAYHLLWQDDVAGAWLPATRPTDEELIWVGYDAVGSPSEVWTYWHGVILHMPWTHTPVEINVQWGKHGSMPRGMRESDLPPFRTLNAFYVAAHLGLPDIWLGRLNRGGPLGFFHGYGRYRDFSRPLPLVSRLDAVLRAGPGEERALRSVFGENYSRKQPWP